MDLPKNILNSIDQLSSLPSIGPRMAERIVMHLAKKPQSQLNQLGDSIKQLSKVGFCQKCFNLSNDKVCKICSNPKRDQGTICVVEDVLDLIAIENKEIYNGLYHVLGGVIKIAQKNNQNKLKIKELLNRIEQKNIKEVIVATNPTTTGDMTAAFIKESLSDFDHLKITRIAKGMPTGAEIEYADSDSISGSFKARRKF
ncbi:MAG: recombination protein RecR [Candidatus Moranbacteria bacterium]|nr:recombination protein RecR [Candidatus Moranbacteria bacterium]